MEALDIVMVISIILFARLGMRLVGKYFSQKKEINNEDEIN